ncbi:DNA polymerase III subunit gamma/tau [Shewanella sp. KT0246]|uniref:DNA polymerase III subunit gamma/tau n=1 Tax=Shewanella sp. KT0246 TaxID=2815912 RepID=UPI001BBADC7C|nr:DNA polymerase III subunit gamma/tau [Shewanella sp. KT0246]GIU53590.1 DNA polymerase III subunit gamma/tau [Shewanella sp. KT0246]
MSYQVLARKWRPAKFEEMVGQSHVLLALTNALTQQRLHHAYLFTGTRGVGKTSLARLFAKGLNCEQGVTSTPCGVCSSCVEIAQGRFVDLIEVDAASRTKVDDTRELLDNVQYKPSRGRFKVYLIDEVHMLSRSSFNALLKTLEEPPEHVKFLLATTDPQKLPVTVLSRCLQFNLKSLSQDEISKQLDFILTQEQLEYEPQALSLLAKAANGSMRDALSLTDQAIAFGSGQVMHQQVQTMLGSIDAQQVIALLKALCDADVANLMVTIQQVLSFGADADEVLRSLLELLHQITLGQFAPAAAQQSLYSEQILAFAEQLTPEQVQLYYQLLLTGRKELAFAPDPKSGLEMALLRAIAFVPEKAVKRWHTDDAAQVSLPAAPSAEAIAEAVSTSELKPEAQEVKHTELEPESNLEPKLEAQSDEALAAEQAILLSQASSLGFNANSEPEQETELATKQKAVSVTEQKLTQSNTETAPAEAQVQVNTPTADDGKPQSTAQSLTEPEIKPEHKTGPLNQPQAQSNDSDGMPMDAYEQFAQASEEGSMDDYQHDDMNSFSASSFDDSQLMVSHSTNNAPQTQVNETKAAPEPTAEEAADLDALLDAVLATNDSLKADLTTLATEGEQVKKQQAAANPSIKVPAPRSKIAAEGNAQTESNQQSNSHSEDHSSNATSAETDEVKNGNDRAPWNKPEGAVEPPMAQAQITKEQLLTKAESTEQVDTASVKTETVSSSLSNDATNNIVDSNEVNASEQSDALAPSQTTPSQTPLSQVAPSTAIAVSGEHEISGDELDLHWYKVMASLSIGGRVRQLAVNSVCQRLENPIPLLLKPDQKHLAADVAIEQLQIALSEHLGEPTTVSITVGLDRKHETPLELRKRFHRELLANANYALINDDKVQWMFTRLAAQLNPDTLVYPAEKLQAIGQQIPALVAQ